MSRAGNLAEAPSRRDTRGADAPQRDEDLDRLVKLADSGRQGINLAKLSRKEIRARLFGD